MRLGNLKVGRSIQSQLLLLSSNLNKKIQLRQHHTRCFSLSWIKELHQSPFNWNYLQPSTVSQRPTSLQQQAHFVHTKPSSPTTTASPSRTSKKSITMSSSSPTQPPPEKRIRLDLEVEALSSSTSTAAGSNLNAELNGADHAAADPSAHDENLNHDKKPGVSNTDSNGDDAVAMEVVETTSTNGPQDPATSATTAATTAANTTATTTSNTSASSKKLISPADVAASLTAAMFGPPLGRSYLTEDDVGILGFLKGDLPGFTGVIKERWIHN
jgi:hypothetical protein